MSLTEPELPPPLNVRNFNVEFISDLYKDRYNQDEISQLKISLTKIITTFNISDNTQIKLNLLRQCESKLNEFIFKHRQSTFADSTIFKSQYDAIIKELQILQQDLGASASSSLDPETSPSNLSQIISSMSPKKANKLAKLLMQGKTGEAKLLSLYDKIDLSIEAKNYRTFLQKHSIEFLGGDNSKNFKIINIDTNKIEVLKVDSRLDLPKTHEMFLHNNYQKRMNDVAIERPVVFKEKGSSICKILMVTEYCENASVFDYGRSMYKGLNGPKKIEFTYRQVFNRCENIFSQMSQVFNELTELNVFFPDSKDSNWLIDKDNFLKLADTKSFLKINLEGQYKKGDIDENKNFKFLCTKFYNPPEYKSTKAGADKLIDADKAHAYILAVNIHGFLTGGGNLTYEKKIRSTFKKGAYIVQPLGPKYKELVISLSHDDPTKRISCKQAMIIINKLNFQVLIDEVNNLSFGKNDVSIKNYIDEKQESFSIATPEQKVAIEQDLKQIIKKFQGSPILSKIKSIIKNLDNRTGILTIKKHTKARSIEDAICTMSIEERLDYLNAPIEKTNKIEKAILKKRTNFNPLHKESTAGKNFLKFKKQYKEQVANKTTFILNEDDDIPDPYVPSK